MPESDGSRARARLGRRTYLKSAGVAALAGLAGCSGGGGGGGSDGESTSSSDESTSGSGESTSTSGGSTSSSGESLTIGALQPFTGTYDWIGSNTKPAYELAFNEIENEGLLGRDTIEINEQDTAVKPQQAKQGLSTLDAAGVPAVIGPSSSVMPSLVQPIQDAQLPLNTVMSGTIQLDDVGGEWLWRSVPSDAVGGAAAALYAYDELGHRNMALTFKNDRGSQSFSEAVGAAFEAKGGTIETKVPLPVNANSYRSQIEELMNADPDIVQMTAATEISSLFVKNYNQLDAKEEFNLMLGNDVLTPDFIETVGTDAAEGFIGQAPAPGPASAQFQEKFNDTYGQEPGAFAAAAYDAANLFALAFQHAGEVARDVIPESLPAVANPGGTEVTTFAEGKAELESGNEINYTGASNPQNFDENGNVVGPFSVLQATGGEWNSAVTYEASTLTEVY